MTDNKRIKNVIDSRLAEVTVSDGLANRIYDSQNSSKKVHKKRFVPVLTACFLLVISIPVMAKTVPGFDRLLSFISSDLAQILQPIQMTSEDNGIKMEVLAALNDDDTAIAYLTLQDLTGNRIDKTLDLYDFTISGADMFTSNVIDYNEQTKTATICMVGNGGSNLDGRKTTVRLTSFLSGKQQFKDMKSGIDLIEAVKNKPQTFEADMSSLSGGGDLFSTNNRKGTIHLLKPDQTDIPLPGLDFVKVSGIGIVDGALHIQTKWKQSIDDHGFLYLEDSAGNRINPNNVNFRTDENGNMKSGLQYQKYIEYKFDITSVKLENYHVNGEFVKNNMYTKGNWETTFRLNAVNKSVQKECNISIGNNKITRVSVSPLGVTLSGTGSDESLMNTDIKISTADGSALKINSVVNKFENGAFKLKFAGEKPLNVENIKAISINGNLVNLK